RSWQSAIGRMKCLRPRPNRLEARPDFRGKTCPTRARKPEAAQPDREFRFAARPQTRCAASYDQGCRLLGFASLNFSCGGAHIFFRTSVERFLVVVRAEIISRAFKHGRRRGLWIDIHSAHRTKRMLRCGNRHDSIGLIRIRVHPAFSLIFHVVSGLPGNLATVIAFDHTEGEIDSGRKTTGGCEISILDEARAALELNVRKFYGKASTRAVIRGRGFAAQQSGFSEDK